MSSGRKAKKKSSSVSQSDNFIVPETDFAAFATTTRPITIIHLSARSLL
jgi:hypothetical protein